MRKPDTIGFIGTGAMGSALIRGLLTAQLTQPSNIIASDADPAKSDALAEELGIVQAASNLDVAQRAET
ncbi:MAG: NAD(P)-binding domain-containing protein, partial [Armatimonadetes bacterium]|nr:NAD(P)-binding domain-containing protein [Armatimonadota bacterium]NIM23337.1 NAD(P)-binding domain-containing protein [Armatimonadota bacterium]NIM67201.1 NAD(P)-binding domain-containing protein [Armatimonadota bacterium]NIM75726.1 NAD(P)-binding domain-containing protein [Armatimonadota bacterium]NIN05390.1 NAD(P)-binding domain-containing protein [Armatimonadota bacterium]